MKRMVILINSVFMLNVMVEIAGFLLFRDALKVKKERKKDNYTWK